MARHHVTKYIKYIWANQISPKSITNFSQSKFDAKMRIKKFKRKNYDGKCIIFNSWEKDEKVN